MKDPFSAMALGMVAGVGVGALIGGALDNVSVGIVAGIAIGGAIGYFMSSKSRR